MHVFGIDNASRPHSRIKILVLGSTALEGNEQLIHRGLWPKVWRGEALDVVSTNNGGEVRLFVPFERRKKPSNYCTCFVQIEKLILGQNTRQELSQTIGVISHGCVLFLGNTAVVSRNAHMIFD